MVGLQHGIGPDRRLAGLRPILYSGSQGVLRSILVSERSQTEGNERSRSERLSAAAAPSEACYK
jgi:hypothetical protein